MGEFTKSTSKSKHELDWYESWSVFHHKILQEGVHQLLNQLPKVKHTKLPLQASRAACTKEFHPKLQGVNRYVMMGMLNSPPPLSLSQSIFMSYFRLEVSSLEFDLFLLRMTPNVLPRHWTRNCQDGIGPAVDLSSSATMV